jgi:tetratricopeptide (TPR) repeat protein
MQIRTPKRYSSRRQKRHLFSLRWLWLWLLTPVVVVAGIAIYRNQDEIAPRVTDFVESIAQSAEDELANRNAPPPTVPPDISSDLTRANDAWGRGAIEEAITLYGEILPATPNDLAVHYRYTLGLIMQGQRDRALEAAADTITANPFSPDAWSIQALAFNRTGQYNDAIASALQALQYASAEAVAENPGIAPARARALALLAEAYLGLDDYARAQTAVDAAFAVDPESAEAYYIQGLLAHFRDFDYVAARANFAAAYERAPGRIDFAERMARTDLELLNYDAMLETYNSILEQNPANVTVLYWMGFYYLNTVGNTNQAGEYLNRCVGARDSAGECHFLLGRARMRQEEYTQALESFERALELDDSNGYYYYWAAEAHINLLDCGAALTYLQTGYRIAQETQDTTLASDFEASLQQCGSPVVAPPVEVTPEVEGGA